MFLEEASVKAKRCRAYLIYKGLCKIEDPKRHDLLTNQSAI